MVPTSALAGSVEPTNLRTSGTASTPSKTMATTGPEVMKAKVWSKVVWPRREIIPEMPS